MLDKTEAVVARHDITFLDLDAEEIAAGYHARCRDCGALFRDGLEWLNGRCPVVP